MHDAIVVGGGLAGATLSLYLAKQGAKVALIERQNPEALSAEETDGRTTAIAAGGRAVMRQLGLWDAVQAQAEAILDIRVSDRRSPMSVHFYHHDVGVEPMGHIIENFRLRRALLDGVESQSRISAFWNTNLTGFTADNGSAQLEVDGSQVIEGRLAVAADGRGSSLRRLASIGVRAHDYKQTAIVCVAHHEHSHDGLAYEHFLDGGPFAILPMPDDAEGRHRSSIVWTERRELAEHLLTLDRPKLEQALAHRFGDFLGQVSILGDCWSFPLSLTVAHRLTGRRLALVGEAAHGIHPLAGQGFNVSIRDITSLGDAVGKALAVGQDPGETALLRRYAHQRWPDILAMVAATDGLNRLFLTQFPPVALARQLGLAAVDRVPVLKRQFQRHAMGLGLFRA